MKIVILFVPESVEIFTHCVLEIVLNNVRRVLLCREPKRKRLFPWQLRRKPPGEATSIPTMLTNLPLSPLLLTKWQLEERVHVAVSVGYEPGVNAMVHHEEEAVLLAGLADLPRCLRGGGGVPGEETAEVYKWHGELRHVGARLLVVGPYELLRYVGLVLEHRGVED